VPDEEGTQTADVAETSLHAYGDGREDDADPGSRGITGDQGTGDEASYQDGGHDGETASGSTPSATAVQDAPGADTGSGAGAADPDGAAGDGGRSDSDDLIDPESPGRAEASRPPRGAPPA
jgi:hypothetical protein